MGTAQRQPHPALIESLLREPGTFEFFRAVELVEEHRARRGRAPRPVGFDHAASEVGLRFEAAPSLAFPARTVGSASLGEPGGAEAETITLAVAFLGLVGPSGVLPTHYTELLLQRLHAKDRALAGFLALFQDRTAAFFYRAWKKYRMTAAFDRAGLRRGQPDPVLTALFGVVGLLPRPRRAAGESPPEELAQAHHAGLFSDRRRSARGLRAMLRGLLCCEVAVEQFVGRWIALDEEARSRLGHGAGPGTSARLGDETVLGARVWSVDAGVRIVAGPLDRARFRSLWPGGEPVRFLRRAIRAYLGTLIDFDLVWELAPDAPAASRLGGDQRLGRDCWLGWSESGGPETKVSSPPWHRMTRGGIPADAQPLTAVS